MATPAKANQVADAVVTALQAINSGSDPATWNTTPGVVKRGMLVADLTITEPIELMVEVGPWSGELPHAAPTMRVSCRLYVHCMVNRQDALAEVQLNDLVKDAAKALRLNPTLGGLVIYGGLNPAYQPQVEVAQRSGFGVATLDWDYYWEDTSI